MNETIKVNTTVNNIFEEIAYELENSPPTKIKHFLLNDFFLDDNLKKEEWKRLSRFFLINLNLNDKRKDKNYLHSFVDRLLQYTNLQKPIKKIYISDSSLSIEKKYCSSYKFAFNWYFNAIESNINTTENENKIYEFDVPVNVDKDKTALEQIQKKLNTIKTFIEKQKSMKNSDICFSLPAIQLIADVINSCFTEINDWTTFWSNDEWKEIVYTRIFPIEDEKLRKKIDSFIKKSENKIAEPSQRENNDVTESDKDNYVQTTEAKNFHSDNLETIFEIIRDYFTDNKINSRQEKTITEIFEDRNPFKTLEQETKIKWDKNLRENLKYLIYKGNLKELPANVMFAKIFFLAYSFRKEAYDFFDDLLLDETNDLKFRIMLINLIITLIKHDNSKGYFPNNRKKEWVNNLKDEIEKKEKILSKKIVTELQKLIKLVIPEDQK